MVLVRDEGGLLVALFRRRNNVAQIDIFEALGLANFAVWKKAKSEFILLTVKFAKISSGFELLSS